MTQREVEHTVDQDEDDLRWSGWLAQAQQGDRPAYEQLLRELAAVIRAHLVRRFGVSGFTDLALLDDCVQESLLAIHQARHSYDPGRPFRPWMLAIVRHRTIDLLRRREPPAEPLDERSPAGPAQDVSAQIDSGRLLSILSGNLREAVILTKFFGLSTRECAKRLGVSESVVKVRVHRGIRQLRAVWFAEAHEHE